MKRIFAFLDRYLEPSDRLGNLLFGLIMVLITTLGARSIVREGPDATRDMLTAAVGCNVGWGIITGGLFVINAMFERGRMARLVRDVREASDENQALDAIRGELGPDLEKVTSALERTRLYRDVLDTVGRIDPPKTRMTRTDVFGALAAFVLVTLTALPAVVPFLFIDNLRLALRVSNLLLVGLLFFVGFRWADEANTNRWSAGLAMMLAGLAMVGAGEALGG